MGTELHTAALASRPSYPTTNGVAAKALDVAGRESPGAFAGGIASKRLALLHELVPRAVRVGLLLNPGNPTIAETTLRNVQEAAPAFGLQIHVLNATNSREIDAAFVTIVQERLEALFVAPDALFAGRGVQLANLAARDRIPSSYSDHENVKAGGLMNYNIDLPDSFRVIGAYAGRILKGTKPADLPVLQPTKFEFVINLQTARLLGIEVPPSLLAIADEVIE
jgi:putative tryptophan/tyrosine transport system substrate-binding protein